MDDAALIDEYLQWRSIRELTPVDTTPQAFMAERVKEMAVDRLEAAIKYIATAPRLGSETQKRLDHIKSILEGTDELEGTGKDESGTDRKNPEQKLGPDNQDLANWERDILYKSDS